MTAKARTISCGPVITDDQIGPRVDWRDVFGNDQPVQIEIGAGKGTILLQLTDLFPQHNILAIEWANKFAMYCAKRVASRGIDNVAVLRTDGREFIIDRIPSASVLAVHAYFPDPWPKKRHRPRRLFVPQFCRALHRILAPNGKVFSATDSHDYFEQIQQNLLADGLFRCDNSLSLLGQDLSSLSGNYENKFRKAGCDIFRLAVEKR